MHLRNVLHQFREGDLTRDQFLEVIREPLFIPEGARLTEQLLRLQDKRRQSALVVNEFGEIRGLVTLDEILEEIVGEFTHPVPGCPRTFTSRPTVPTSSMRGPVSATSIEKWAGNCRPKDRRR
ncbi:MAG: CBS domain-containing protein [Gammaproteobacteria bacterium]|nr:CBS domain-containing protein [Gammaproteobacteria bacterium]